MVQEGAAIIRERIKTYDISCDLKDGNLFAAYTTKQMRELEDKQMLWRRHGMDEHELLDQEGMRAHVGSNVYAGGMIDHSGGHMHPLNLALGEAAAFEKNGGVIYEMSPVTVDRRQRCTPRDQDRAGCSLRCSTLLLCGNAYLGSVVRALTPQGHAGLDSGGGDRAAR